MSILRLSILLLAIIAGCATKYHPTLTLSSDPQPSVVVKGLDPHDLKNKNWLTVRVFDAGPQAPPIVGEIIRKNNDLIFTPRYPFQPGLKYFATFASLNSIALATEFTLPSPSEKPATKVSAIYPSSPDLPQNLLKFYIHFSAPMSHGEAYQRISLLDENGTPVARPFLELTEELWNPETTRFTLFFEPGRIKQGLVPNKELGPSLTVGHSYTLVIDGAWSDGENRPLVESARKTFRVVPSDHTQPDPARWQINSPAAGSKEPLSISFDEPLDHAMLNRVLSVRDATSRELFGAISIDEREQRWSFTPNSPWQRGRYSVIVESILEDVAGNSIARPFEVDLNRGSSSDRPEHVEIRFDVAVRTYQKS